MTEILIGLLLLLGCGTLCVVVVGRLLRRLRSVVSGTAVEGRCVRVYATDGNDGGTHWHHVYGFTTLDGQYVEFEEDAFLMAEGQVVTVRYRPVDPARTATVMGSGGTWSPLIHHAVMGLVSGGLALFGLFLLWLRLNG
ncbi:DUF3592 domain-containing protein [Streptomyces sp. NPDC031705]|uniref:DUF3592 domain-containing protein n=1 Tax=Streptomyces sp. NPDC031705 TaxID=3155729 RepID=UPI0033FB1CB8